MKLLEVVRAAQTSKEVLATAMKLSRTIKKVGVVAGVCDGFIGNRMLHGYFREAGFLLEEGALPQQVDKVIEDFGFAMGPFRVSDLAGLDVGWYIRKRQAATRPPHLRYSKVADQICEMGRFGQKTGAGWYRYEAGNRTPIPDPEIEALIVKASKEAGIERREVTDQEILERCMYALVNTGAQILEEGIALRASDIDIVYLYGYGFPRYRGGPMFYADSVGLDRVYAAVERFHGQHGEFWTPSALLKKLAGEGGRFNPVRATRRRLRAAFAHRNQLPVSNGDSTMTEAVIVSTARTPLCKSWRGAFNMTHGATLGGHVVKHAVAARTDRPRRGRGRDHGLRQPRGRHRLQHRAPDRIARRPAGRRRPA